VGRRGGLSKIKKRGSLGEGFLLVQGTRKGRSISGNRKRGTVAGGRSRERNQQQRREWDMPTKQQMAKKRLNKRKRISQRARKSALSQGRT